MLIELAAVVVLAQDRPPDPICQADVRWAVSEPLSISRSATAQPRVLTVFSAVGDSRSANCRPIDLSLTAAFYRGDGELLCTGALSGVARHGTTTTQVTALEIRAGSLFEFVRWRNTGRNLRQSMALTCTSLDGVTEVPVEELTQARTLRLWITAATSWTGLATDELILTLAP